MNESASKGAKEEQMKNELMNYCMSKYMNERLSELMRESETE